MFMIEQTRVWNWVYSSFCC